MDCLSVGDFASVLEIMEQRLLNSLCLTEAPTVGEGEDVKTDPLWDQLLADALDVSVQVKQDQGLQSESMRNYSYQLRDYANTWELLAKKSKDLLNKFNACASGIIFQRDLAACIYGHDHYYRDCDSCRECV